MQMLGGPEVDFEEFEFLGHGLATMFGARARLGNLGQGGGKVWQA